ncbi:MAG: VWA domain-containing protein [Chloroflexota bacterium]
MNDETLIEPLEQESEEQKQWRRWRLILGGGPCDGICISLGGHDQQIDHALTALYGKDQKLAKQGGSRQGGMGKSILNVARWLGDIREYFPTPIVRIMQQDAIERLGLRQLLMEPEILETLDPDEHLVAELLSLKHLLPDTTRDTARLVVKKLVDDLLRRLTNPMRQAVLGSLNRAIRNRRPRHQEIDWNRTIRINLKHYQPEYKTVIPERLIGFSRRRSAMRDVILCIDESGSMATSVVYASVFGAVLASLPAVRTHLVVFDTSVVDLTPGLSDPVDVLFGTQLGGGTDIDKALGYCQQLITRPQDTIFVLISDLYEGGDRRNMMRRASSIVASGVQFIALLALNDDGAPSFDSQTAKALAKLGIVSFACTPQLFPDLMAATINRKNIAQWATSHNIPYTHQSERE